MKRFLLGFLLLSLAVSCTKDKPAETFDISRGVNIAHWLSQSRARGEARAAMFTEADVRQIAGWGFDHIRIPIDEEQMFHEDGSKDEEAFRLLHDVLDWCDRYGLRAVVDLHILRSHYFDAEVKPLFTEESAQESFYECWRKISGELKDYSNAMVAYELMNEPVADDPEDWNKIVRRCYDVIRELEKDRVLVIGSNLWQSFHTVDQLYLPEGDPNIILSFHYYNPMVLSHYQAGWTEYRNYGGPVHYPGQVLREDELSLRPETEQKQYSNWTAETYDKERFASEFSRVLAVASRYGIPVYCGEYGCLNVPENDEARYAWLTDMNEVFDSLGIARAVWCYREGPVGFGIISFSSTEPDRRMLEALTGKE